MKCLKCIYASKIVKPTKNAMYCEIYGACNGARPYSYYKKVEEKEYGS